jgi:hypothetical protein
MSDGTDRKKPLSFIGPMTNVHTHASGVLLTALYNLSEDELQYWGANKSFLTERLQDALKVDIPYAAEKEYWRKFYQKYFGLNLNFSITRIPLCPQDGSSYKLLIIAQGLMLNHVYKAMSKAFKCWKYADDLEASVTKNARDTKNAYAIWVLDSVEPDENYLGRSTNEVDPDMTIGVTLLERMIHEIAYFDETGKHLDIKGVTFCSGSRNSDGRVPGVGWDSEDRKVFVYWCFLDFCVAKYGVRSAVSM